MIPRQLVNVTIESPPRRVESPVEVASLPVEAASDRVAHVIAEMHAVWQRASVAERLDAWAGSTGDKAKSLVAAWRAHGTKDEAVHLTHRSTTDGRTVFVVRCANGYHESFESHEHALEQLVDAHRIGVEDLGTTRDLVWWAESDRDAQRILAAIAAIARTAEPKLKGNDLDIEILARVEALDATARAEWAVTASAAQIEAARIADPQAWATDRRTVIQHVSGEK